MKTIASIAMALAGMAGLFVSAVAENRELSSINAEQRRGQQVTKADQMFFLQLSEAARKNNTGWIADHVSFPITIKIDGKQRMIKTRYEFVAQYENIFNNKVRSAIESQQPDALFKNWRGLMVGHGEIWFTAVHPDPNNPQRTEYYITGVNNGNTE